jgi:septal ring factor EnvC (AmiA/AmiB activator)
VSGFTPWRRTTDAPVPTPPVDETAKYRAQLQQLRNERAALTGQLRDTARERDQLTDQVRAGRLMLDAALKACEARCSHAVEAAGLRVQLAALQARLDEMQAVNEGYERLGYARVPAQRRH